MELGPGRGTLAADARRAMARAGFEPSVHLVETSPVLRAAQAERMGGATWHEAVDAGIVINGLPILAFEPYLDQYFNDAVIGGPGAFMIAAKSFETFAEAILMKLIIEIAGVRQPQSASASLDGSTSMLKCCRK